VAAQSSKIAATRTRGKIIASKGTDFPPKAGPSSHSKRKDGIVQNLGILMIGVPDELLSPRVVARTWHIWWRWVAGG
jgi:hypothetical protein